MQSPNISAPTLSATPSSAALVTDAARTNAQTNRPKLLAFPETVDENAARLVASGVVVMGATVLLGQRWVLIPLALGFLARVLSGPRFSPLALLVTRVVVPRLVLQGHQVTGAPKRFAQGVGLTFSGSALVAWALGASAVTTALMVGLVAAASLEAVFGLCLGCKMYALLQRIGWINEDACVDCADISRRVLA